jgi:uncharacterized protein
MGRIIGRKKEIELLNSCLKSTKSELVVVYGRRRVGKTYLIREFFKNELIFEVTGLYNGSIRNQLSNFSKEIHRETKGGLKSTPKNWLDAFTELENFVGLKRSKKKKVIFIDEFPWIATPKSNFLMAFENFWNHFATKRDDLIVVVCGSAASYMAKKIIHNKGGLHNRITQTIRLLPFDIKETQMFLKSRGVQFTQYDLIQLYMAIGGVPHYLDHVDKTYSVAQNIDALCFQKDGALTHEFNHLFASLFNESEKHVRIIRTLAKVNKGIPRKLLLEKSGFTSGGDFSLKLTELIESGFVSEYAYFRNKKQLTLFRLTDEYCLFYIKFIEKHLKSGIGTWVRLSKSQSYISWSGFSFETLCLKHIHQIKKALKIEGVYTIHSSWFNENAQIDLVIDRDDNVINLFEIKFYASTYTIDKKYYLNLKNKLDAFQIESNSSKNIFFNVISCFGFKENLYYKELINSQLNVNLFFD